MSIFESHEQTQRRIEQEHMSRLVLFCRDCQQMQLYTADSLTWHCAECGGGDLRAGEKRPSRRSGGRLMAGADSRSDAAQNDQKQEQSQ